MHLVSSLDEVERLLNGDKNLTILPDNSGWWIREVTRDSDGNTVSHGNKIAQLTAEVRDELIREMQKGRFYKQFELAQKIYAAHRLSVHVTDGELSRSKIEEFLSHAVKEFKDVGGVVKTGTDVFGERGPVLYREDGHMFDYESGRLLAENFLADRVFAA